MKKASVPFKFNLHCDSLCGSFTLFIDDLNAGLGVPNKELDMIKTKHNSADDPLELEPKYTQSEHAIKRPELPLMLE
jgi:hypothetical protein